MKVICVKKCITYNNGRSTAPSPEVGDIDEVISTHALDGELYYSLVRFDGYAFLTENFAILPDQTEEVIEEPELIHA